jgi:cytochrome d ubiquinol oxidase subunit II
MEVFPTIWLALIGFGIIMYVILDGFDLGVGILSFFMPKEQDRDLMISTIMPVWDGNETWLVFGAAALYGAFPDAFSTLLPKFYVPIFIMLCSLLLRGVSFEFLHREKKTKRLWELAFFVGSLIATFIQGVILGTFVGGFNPDTVVHYAWLTPFSFTCGAALVFGYVLLGSNWLIMKTEDSLQQTCFKVSKIALIVIALFAFVISVWTPWLDPAIKERWFNPEWMFYLAILPLAGLVAVFLHWQALEKKREAWPFFLSVAIFLLCYLGFAISSWPYIVPRYMTFVEAAAPDGSLIFMTIGAVVMLPLLLFYTFHSYRVFHGKVKNPLS